MGQDKTVKMEVSMDFENEITTVRVIEDVKQYYERHVPMNDREKVREAVRQGSVVVSNQVDPKEMQR
jgi:hypothetical protein